MLTKENVMYRAAIVTTFLLFLISTDASEVIQDQRTVKFDYTLYGDVRDKNELDGITTDAQGNTIMGGPFQNTVIFDYQGNNPKTRTARNGTDIYNG